MSLSSYAASIVAHGPENKKQQTQMQTQDRIIVTGENTLVFQLDQILLIIQFFLIFHIYIL